MRGLLCYAFVLALGVAIGAYVLGPLNFEDRVADASEQNAITGQQGSLSSATPPSVEEELDYKVARQFASLAGLRAFLTAHPNGAYARSARAEVARRLGADGASADGAAPPTGNDPADGLSRRIVSLASNAQSATARVEQLLLGETAPASGDLSSVAPSWGDAPPPADGASGAKLAAVAPEEICQREEDRLEQLRLNPTRRAVARFANELGCEKLRSQLLDLFERLAPPPAATRLSDARSPAAPAANETAHAASTAFGPRQMLATPGASPAR